MAEKHVIERRLRWSGEARLRSVVRVHVTMLVITMVLIQLC